MSAARERLSRLLNLGIASSHAALRRAYLAEAKRLHPDSRSSSATSPTTGLAPSDAEAFLALQADQSRRPPSTSPVLESVRTAFALLPRGAAPQTQTPRHATQPEDSHHHTEYFLYTQAAWERYASGRAVRRRIGKNDDGATFATFGVGCSFSDNPEEQMSRQEFMDCAARGELPRAPIPR